MLKVELRLATNFKYKAKTFIAQAIMCDKQEDDEAENYNCFIRWVLILSRVSSRIDPIHGAQADNIRRGAFSNTVIT